MAEARAFQQGLLPDREAVVNRLAICCRYTPCSGLGGDLYDYAAAASGQTALLIADVSGHGVSAAMLTGIVKSAFQASHVDGFEPLAVVQRVWTGLAAFSPERFVTLVAALIAPDRSQLRYVNAGHPPIVVVGRHAEAHLAGEHRPAGLPGAARIDVGRTGGADGRGRSASAVYGRRLGGPRPTTTAARKRDSRPSSNGRLRAARRCWTRFSPRFSTSSPVARSRTI